MVTISIIMANYRGAAHLDAAIASVLRQTHADLELIVADDASPDHSVAVIRDWMRRDPRVRLIESAINAGASAARNRALEAARGAWVAIMDSDDICHPDRFARLLAAAQQSGATMVADDMLFFSETADGAGRTLLQPLALAAPRGLDAATLLASDLPESGLPPFGYLKFLIAREAIGALRYDEELRIAEDFDFYLRLLGAGARALLLPEPMYLYRRHSASLSHRLSGDAIARMLRAQQAAAEGGGPLAPLLAARTRHLRRQLGFQRLVAAIKRRDPVGASAQLLRRPGLIGELGRSLRERRARRGAGAAGARSPRPLVLSATGAAPLDLPRLVAPGQPWARPIAPLCAELSRLASAHALEIEAIGPEGLWFLWLVPGWTRARWRPDGSGAAALLPLPEGVEIVSAGPQT